MHVKVEGINFGAKEWRWRLRGFRWRWRLKGCNLRLKGWRFRGVV